MFSNFFLSILFAIVWREYRRKFSEILRRYDYDARVNVFNSRVTACTTVQNQKQHVRVVTVDRCINTVELTVADSRGTKHVVVIEHARLSMKSLATRMYAGGSLKNAY